MRTIRLALCGLAAAALSLTSACESEGTDDAAADVAAEVQADVGADAVLVDSGHDAGVADPDTAADPGAVSDPGGPEDTAALPDTGGALDVGLDAGQPDTGGSGDAVVDAAPGEVSDQDDAGIPDGDAGEPLDAGAAPDVDLVPCGDGDAPECWSCDADAPIGVASCVGGYWQCATGVFVADLDCGTDPSCALYGGELCCGADGAVTDALCPSPSQAYCVDGSTPQLTCNVLGVDQCRSGSDCDNMKMCQGPGDPAMCGICFEPEPSELCTSDADCTPGATVCEQSPVSCLCSPAMLCTAACTADADCDEGETCGADGHCAATACAADADCPALFSCQDSDAPSCARKSCSADPDCGAGGWCVKNQCHPQPGFCTYPPA